MLNVSSENQNRLNVSFEQGRLTIGCSYEMLCCLETAICRDYCLVVPSYKIGLQKDETNSPLIWFNLQELLPFIVNWIRKRSEGLLSYVTTVAPELNGQRDEGSLTTPPLHQTHIPETISNIRGLKYSQYEGIDVGKSIRHQDILAQYLKKGLSI